MPLVKTINAHTFRGMTKLNLHIQQAIKCEESLMNIAIMRIFGEMMSVLNQNK